MQRNPHSYQIATGYRTFYSLSLIYQPITKKRLFFIKKLIDRFYTDYTTRDIITYRRDYAIKELKEFEQALSELDGKDNLED